MDSRVIKVAQKADRIVKTCGTCDPFEIARKLDIEIIPCNFKTQLSVYKMVLNNHFIFIKKDLHPAVEVFVMLHEIGHAVLHRQEVSSFNCCKGRLECRTQQGQCECRLHRGQHECGLNKENIEWEANIFATRIFLQNERFKAYAEKGFDAGQITEDMQLEFDFIIKNWAEHFPERQ